MDTELIFTIGAVLCVLALISAIAALSDSRPPRVAVLVFVTGVALVCWAITLMPRPISWGDFPNMIYAMIGRLMH